MALSTVAPQIIASGQFPPRIIAPRRDDPWTSPTYSN